MSPSTTPFIPPLPSPQQSPQVPVIPSPVNGSMSGAPPPPSVPPHSPWTYTPRQTPPSGYPIFPATPYNAPAFIPNATPSMRAGPMPGAYPVGPPVIPPPPGASHNGISVDYAGYPQGGQPSPWGPMPATLHPPPPWPAPMSAPVGGPPPSWARPGPPSYPPFPYPPQGGPVYSGGGPPPGWGGPFTPGMSPGMFPTADWSMQTPLPPTWAAQHNMMMGMPPPQPRQPSPALPEHLVAAQASNKVVHAKAYIGDRVDPFMPGKHYGPVLEPFLVRIVGAELKLNPLLDPPPEDGSEKVHLEWNMVFPPSNCRRSTDPTDVSWSAGRNAPATFPRVTSLRIVSETFPWVVQIHAKSPSVGVLCGEVIDGLSDHFYTAASGNDFKALPPRKQREVSDTYVYNRSRALDVPGGRLGRGTKRLDYLCKDTMFGGLTYDERVIKNQCGEALPCTFALKCLRRYPLTAEEARQRAETRRTPQPSEAAHSDSPTEDDTENDD